MALQVFVEVESAPGTVTGAGPITDITMFSTTSRLNSAGSWTMSLPATESQASLLTDQRTIMAYVMIDGAKVLLGGGAIDRKRTRVDDTGRLTLDLSGVDLLGEWSRVALDNLILDGSGVDNITALLANAPTGWNISIIGTSKNFKRQFINETPLNAMVAVAKQMGHYFRRQTSGFLGVRTLVWQIAFPTSISLTCVMNLNALEAEDNPDLATIVSIEELRTSYDIINSIYVSGAGSGENVLTLAAATLWPNDTTALGSAYSGASGDSYDYDSATNTITNTTSQTAYGTRSKALSFGDIRPIYAAGASVGTIDTATVAAANALVKAAVAYLEQHRAPQVVYKMKLADLRTRLYPGDLIHIDARRWIDGAKPVDIDADVYVLSVTDRLDANGVWTADIDASNVAVWPEDTVSTLVQAAQVAQTVQAHPQMTGNVDTVSCREVLMGAGAARFWIFLSREVALINEVKLRYFARSMEAPIANAGGATSDVMVVGDFNAMTHTVNATAFSSGTQPANPDIPHSHAINTHDHDITVDAHPAHNHIVEWGHTLQDAALTYTTADLEFNINGETSGGLVWRSGSAIYTAGTLVWNELDITAQVRNAVTKRPNSTNNAFTIDVVAKAAAADVTFSAIVDTQIQVRSAIQQIATF